MCHITNLWCPLTNSFFKTISGYWIIFASEVICRRPSFQRRCLRIMGRVNLSWNKIMKTFYYMSLHHYFTRRFVDVINVDENELKYVMRDLASDGVQQLKCDHLKRYILLPKQGSIYFICLNKLHNWRNFVNVCSTDRRLWEYWGRLLPLDFVVSDSEKVQIQNGWKVCSLFFSKGFRKGQKFGVNYLTDKENFKISFKNSFFYNISQVYFTHTSYHVLYHKW